jgi:hypothetical protein
MTKPAKTSIQKTAKTVRNAFEWRDIAKLLEDAETRSYVAQRILKAGFSLDSLQGPKTRAILADALTRAEDKMELSPKTASKDAARAKVRVFRRALERELWP